MEIEVPLNKYDALYTTFLQKSHDTMEQQLMESVIKLLQEDGVTSDHSKLHEASLPTEFKEMAINRLALADSCLEQDNKSKTR
jgi:mannitol-1-phosphate/altronate dehydrogenase